MPWVGGFVQIPITLTIPVFWTKAVLEGIERPSEARIGKPAYLTQNKYL